MGKEIIGRLASGKVDPTMDELLEIATVIIAAKLVGELCERIQLSPILGQIIVGVVVGPSVLGLIEYDHAIRLLAELGIVILIFVVGLQTRVQELREVGRQAASAAGGGVLLPFALGMLLAALEGLRVEEGLILGAALTATSVAITAGVLMDLGKIRTKAAELILAAAVMDDVFGLLALTLVVGVVGAGAENPLMDLLPLLVFLVLVLPAGWKLIPLITRRLAGMRVQGSLFGIVVGIALIFAYLAEWSGLAAIVGAFLVGAIIAGGPYGERVVSNALPVYYFLSPFFFVSVGILFDLGSVIDAPLLVVAIASIAIVGKLVGCGVGARLTGVPTRTSIFVGVGMIPRGEVALIVATFARSFEIEAGNPLLGSKLFSMVAGMVMITALLGPILVRYLSRRFEANLNEVG